MGVVMPKWRSSFEVRRVSSAAITLTAFSVANARSVMSSRFPIGVDTTNKLAGMREKDIVPLGFGPFLYAESSSHRDLCR